MRVVLASTPLSFEKSEPCIELASAVYGDSDNILPFPSPSGPQLGFSILAGDKGNSLSCLLGDRHHTTPTGIPHPSHYYTHRSIVRHIADEKDRIVRRPDPIICDAIPGSAAIIGGPVSTLPARLLLGVGGPSPMLETELPVYFDLSRYNDAVKTGGEPWRVVVNGRQNTAEYLLLTSIPYRDHDRIINICGLSPVGQMATELLLSNEAMLKRLHVKTRKHEAWQALFQVAVANGRPLGLTFVDVFPIAGVDFNASQYAERTSRFWDIISLTSCEANNILETTDELNNLLAYPLFTTDLLNQMNAATAIKEFKAALNTIARVGASAYPDQANKIDKFVAAMAVPTIAEGKEVWLPPPPGRRKTTDTVTESPAAFLRRAYRDEIESGLLTREKLAAVHVKMPQAYARWISPDRHPEDAIWPETDNQEREKRQLLSGLTPAEKLQRLSEQKAISKAKARKKTPLVPK